MLHRLVGRAVLAETDRVVRPHVRHRQVHQRGQTHGVAHVVGEHQEGAAVDAGVAVQCDAVHGRGHGVLADTEVDRSAVRVRARQRVARREERRRLVDRGVVRAGEVGGAAPQLGDDLAERLEHLAGGGAGGDRLARLEDRKLVLPARGQLARRDPVELGGALRVGGAPRGELLLPLGLGLAAAVQRLTGVRDDLVGDLEGLLRVEAQHLLGRGDLVVAERRAVRRPRCSGRAGPARR